VLAGLGFKICARTVAKYMRKRWNGQPSPHWRQFLGAARQGDLGLRCLHGPDGLVSRTLRVFRHPSRVAGDRHARVTAIPTAERLAQQMTQACDVDRGRRAT
jgi:hypothetical protein